MVDPKDKRIAELERQLAEAKEDTARLDGVLKRVRELIGGTASIILLPGRKTLNNADVSASVVTNARKACEAIDAARKETK